MSNSTHAKPTIQLGDFAMRKVLDMLIGMHGLDMSPAEHKLATIMIQAGYCHWHKDRLIYNEAFR